MHSCANNGLGAVRALPPQPCKILHMSTEHTSLQLTPRIDVLLQHTLTQKPKGLIGLAEGNLRFFGVKIDCWYMDVSQT